MYFEGSGRGSLRGPLERARSRDHTFVAMQGATPSKTRDPINIRGIVTPIWFAALRLMMNSNLISCSKGILAG